MDAWDRDKRMDVWNPGIPPDRWRWYRPLRGSVVWDGRFFPGVYTPGFMISPFTGLGSFGRMHRIETTTGTFVTRLNASGETTRTGRRPCCSCPSVGSSPTSQISSRFIRSQAIPFPFGDRVGCFSPFFGRGAAQIWGFNRVSHCVRCDVKKIPNSLVGEIAKSGKPVA